tara:strand:+ start:364848 stop:365672 length:825 start_codon:yes stop_codon:yes gene_type:complete
MFPRFRLLAILAAAAGGPYVASETEWGRSMSSRVTNVMRDVNELRPVSTRSSDGFYGGSSQKGNGGKYANHAHHEVETLRGSNPQQYRYDEQIARKLGAIPSQPGTEPELVGARVSDLREVLRFDITPDWVINRFARVSTVLADLNLEGLRVPIVTGTRADDMAGTLTYYFDRRGTLQRLTIHGFTGHPAKLVGTMTQFYGLQTEPSLEAGVYTRRWNGLPVHFLRLTHAPVVYSDAVHQKYTVFMELNQPNLAYGISDEAKRIVISDRGSGRW